MPREKFAVAIVLLLLVGGPLVGEYLANREASRRPLFDTDSLRYYECSSLERCRADFDGDGVEGRIEVITLDRNFRPNNRALLVIDGNRELLWLPFYHVDYARPTRVAVRADAAGTRLLVSDMSYPYLGEAVFEWNGVGLARGVASDADRFIFASMATSEAEPNGLLSVLKLLGYYLILAALAAVWLYRKSVQLSRTQQSHFLRGNP